MGMLRMANKFGIPCLEVQNIVVNSTNVVFQFAEHPAFRENFQGLFLIRNTKTFTAPETALPVVFETIGVPGSQVAITGVGGAAITSTQLTPTGIWLLFYDRPTNVLQIFYQNPT